MDRDQRKRVAEMIDVAIRKATVEVQDLAKATGVSRTALHRWRNGERVPTPANMRRLAMALRARAGELEGLAESLEREAARRE